mgnify:CR=1 FL=1
MTIGTIPQKNVTKPTAERIRVDIDSINNYVVYDFLSNQYDSIKEIKKRIIIIESKHGVIIEPNSVLDIIHSL